jgi:hypothetical protein
VAGDICPLDVRGAGERERLKELARHEALGETPLRFEGDRCDTVRSAEWVSRLRPPSDGHPGSWRVAEAG